MATVKTVINCMPQSIEQTNQGISISIDQHINEDQLETQQQVCVSSSNLISNSNVIKIQHSNEQAEQQQQQHQQQFLTLNNKSNKTLIDINCNSDNNHHYHHDDCVNEIKNEQNKIQINCSSICSEFSREMLENKNIERYKLNCNGVLTERGNLHNEIQANGEEKKLNLAKQDSVVGKQQQQQVKERKEEEGEEENILTKYSTQQTVEEDVEESGQTASQQQQEQQQPQQPQQQQQQQLQQQVNANNSKNRENGQNSIIQLKFKLNNHNDDEELYHNNEDVANDNNETAYHNIAKDDDNNRDHYHKKLTTNREDNNEVISSSGRDCTSSSGNCIGIGNDCGLLQREALDLSHGKRSVIEENSNSLLTQADATTCTNSTTLLTVNATNIDKVTTQNEFYNSANFIKHKNINHVVKIQIKPNNINNNNNTSDKCKTLTEKQVTVVKIENLQELNDTRSKTIKQNNKNQENNKLESRASEKNIENKKEVEEEEEEVENTQHKLKTQLNDDLKMVQKPSNNNNCTSNATMVTVVANSNANGNVSNTSGAVTAVTSTTGTTVTVTELNVTNPNNYLYYMMSSGQFSPCDTLDSGTGSDLESNGQQQQSLKTNLQIKKSSNSSSSSASSASSSSSSSTTSTTSHNSVTAPIELHLKTTKIRVANSNNCNSLELQQRQCSFTDSEESEASSLSCDSLHSNEFLRQSSTSPLQIKSVALNGSKKIQSFLPDSLLREIKNLKFSSNDYEAENEEEDDILPSLKSNNEQTLSNHDYIKSHEFMQSRKNLNNLPTNISSSLKRASLPSKTFVLNTEDGTFIDTKMNSMPRTYEADKYYNFHVNEHDNFRSFGNNNNNNNNSNMNGTLSSSSNGVEDSLSITDYETKSLLHDDVFAGYRDIRCGSNTSTIRSSKGTVRGVKNRVRNGIATFLQLQQPNIKNYKEKDSGKVVLYTTSMGIIRDTYAKCSNVKQILRTLLVKFEERDVFMSVEYQQEIKERMHSDVIKVPQLYVEGQHIGNADTVERLNESGELRQLLKPYKSISTTYTCQTCGGYRLLPCPSCNGSKKSVHRNHFTAEFVALKCMNCDEVGLVKCHNC